MQQTLICFQTLSTWHKEWWRQHLVRSEPQILEVVTWKWFSRAQYKFVEDCVQRYNVFSLSFSPFYLFICKQKLYYIEKSILRVAIDPNWSATYIINIVILAKHMVKFRLKITQVNFEIPVVHYLNSHRRQSILLWFI